MKLVKWLLIIFIALRSFTLLAGWEIVYRITDSEGSINYEVMLIEHNIMKYTGNAGAYIFNSVNGEFTFIVENGKSYWSGNIDDFRIELDKAMHAISDDIINELPETQADIYEQFLNELTIMYSTPTPEASDSVKLVIKDTGIVKEIAGYNANKFEISINDQILESVWINSGLDMSKDFNPRTIVEVMNQVEPNTENDVLYKYNKKYSELFNAGIAMQSEKTMGETTTVIKVEQREISAEELSIPDNYAKVTPAQLIQQQLMGGYQENDKDW